MRDSSVRIRPTDAGLATCRGPLLACLLLLACAAATPSAQVPAQSPAQSAVPAAPTSSTSSAAAAVAPANVVAAPPSPPIENPIPLEADDAVWGSPSAPLTLVEYADLQCPFSARVQATIAELQARYGPTKLRVIYRHNPLPFHPQAREAAEVAQAVHDLAGSAASFAFMARAFADQSALGPAAYQRWLAALGLDAAAVLERARSRETGASIDRDLSSAKRLGARGTPTFFANGKRIQGAQPRDTFISEFDAQLVEANALLAGGLDPGLLYPKLTAARYDPAAAASPSTPPAPPDLERWKLPVAGAPARGPRDALVTIVGFYDYQCPFTKRVQTTMDLLLERYPKDVRLVVRQHPLPFHKQARPAAALAIEAQRARGDEAFFALSRQLFERAPELDAHVLTELGRAARLDPQRVQRVLHDNLHGDSIEKDEYLAEAFAALGTPHFFINGMRVSGAQPLDTFVAAVERELATARVLVSAGVARSKVYAALMKEAKDAVPPEYKPIPLPDDPIAKGPDQAPIVIQIFADFECPFTQRVQPTLAALERAHPGQIRWVWRNLPLGFHKNAERAATLALEAREQLGDTTFWSLHDALFDAQTREGLPQPVLQELAQRFKLDLTRLNASIASGTHVTTLAADREAARMAGLVGVPIFVVNGYLVRGAQPQHVFEKVIRYAKGHPHGPGAQPAP